MGEEKREVDPLLPEIVILKIQADGRAYWVEASADLQSARARVQTLGESFPGEYLILNQRTGEETRIRVDPPGG